MDTVYLHGIRTELIVGLDAWHREDKVQPVSIDVELVPPDSLEAAANDDNVALTLDYGKLYKSLVATLTAQAYSSLHHLVVSVQDGLPPTRSSAITVTLPKAVLLLEGGLVFTRRTLTADDGGPAVYQKLEMKRLICHCVIGVNAHERVEKQRLILTISADGVSTALGTAVLAGISIDGTGREPVYVAAVKDVVERVESSSYQTVEALATAVAQLVTMNHGFENATVRIDKPNAIASIEAAGVQLTRRRSFFENKDFWKVKRP